MNNGMVGTTLAGRKHTTAESIDAVIGFGQRM